MPQFTLEITRRNPVVGRIQTSQQRIQAVDSEAATEAALLLFRGQDITVHVIGGNEHGGQNCLPYPGF